MNTGKEFELRVKRILEGEIQRGEYGIDPAFINVFHRKGYFSRDRKKEIIVDVSMEVVRKGGRDPYLIWIWECKNYSGAVPVDDIEEFHAKLEQFELHRVRGTVASPNGFMKGAYEYAKAKGIGLVRIIPDGSPIRLLESVRTISQYEVEFGLTEPSTAKILSPIYALSSDGQGFDGLADLISFEFSGNG